MSKPLACSGSASTSKTGSRGSSDATGSWKTTCRSPRSARRAAPVQCRRRRRRAPRSSRTAGRSGPGSDAAWSICRSRTRRRCPSVRPCCSSKLTPSTARTSPIVAAEHHTLGQRVGLDQIAHPQHDRIARLSAASAARCGGDAVDVGGAAPGDLLGADARGAGGRGRPCTSSGSAVRHSSIASGQRGANGQPGGSAASDGGAPGIGTSRAPCGASSRGTEPEQPCGVRHPAIAVQLGDRRRSRPPGRRTSPGRGRRTRRRPRGRG